MLEVRELSDQAGGGWCVDTGRKWYVIRTSGQVLTRIASAAGIERRPATKDERCAAFAALRLSHFFVSPGKRKVYQSLSAGVAGATGIRKARRINDLAAVRQTNDPNKTKQNP